MSMLFVFEVAALIPPAVLPSQQAFPMHPIFVPLAIVDTAVLPFVDAYTYQLRSEFTGVGGVLTFTIHLIVAEKAFVSVAIAPDKKAFSLFHALSELSNEPTAISCPLFKSTVSILQVILPAAPIQRPICLPQCCYATCLSFLPFALIYISIDSAYQSTIEVKHVFREVAFVKTAIWKHLEAVAFFLAVS